MHKNSGFAPIKNGQIYYECYGNGEPIIVIHGGPGLTMDYLFPHLIDLENFAKVIFYDQRGTGQSIACDISNDLINIEQFIEDLEDLRITLKLEQFILLGHSFGGLLAMQYAIKYPNRVKGMILMSSLPANYDGQLAFAQEFNRRILGCENKLTAFEDVEQFNQLNLDEIHELYETIFSFYFYEPSRLNLLQLKFEKKSAKNGFLIEKEMANQSIFKEELNLLPELSRITNPCLIIHGARDIIPLQTAQKIHETIQKSQMIILNECDHFPFIEKQSETLQVIDEFIRSI